MNPMRITGIVLLLLAALIFAFGIFTLMPSGSAATPGNPPTESGSAVPSAWVIFPFGVVALIAGVAVLLFGGRGVIRTRNPAVRN